MRHLLVPALRCPACNVRSVGHDGLGLGPSHGVSVLTHPH